MQSLSPHHHLLCNSWWDNSTLKVTHPLAIALKPSNTLNAMLESCDFTLLYAFWCHTVNPLIKENRIILAVADGEVERALLKYLYCVRFLRWFTNPIPSEACLLMSLSKQWCFGHTKEGHLVINKIYFSKKRNKKKFNWSNKCQTRNNNRRTVVKKTVGTLREKL